MIYSPNNQDDHAGGLHYSLSEFFEYVGEGSAVCDEYFVTGGLMCWGLVIYVYRRKG